MTETPMEAPDVVVITPYDSYTRHLFNAPDPLGEDAGVLCLERWKEAHSDDIQTLEDLKEREHWWDHLDAQSDWQLCQKYRAPL